MLRLLPLVPSLMFTSLLACGGDAGSGDAGDTAIDPDTADTVADADTAVQPDTVDDTEVAPDVSDTSDTADTDDAPDAPDTVDTGDASEVDTVVGPECGNGVPEAGEACDDGDLDDLDGCTRVCEVGPVVRPPMSGEVVIAELMIAPSRVSDLHGEWIELVSLASEPLNLSGCELVDEGTDRVALDIEGGLVLEPGERLVLGGDSNPATNGGAAVDLAYATMLLEDLGDEVILVCGEVVDRVAWTPFAWPIIEGRALSLDPSRHDGDANDRVDSWCSGLGRYGLGDFGSPGAANPSCPHLDREIDRCRLVGPALAQGFRDSPTSFTIEVEELGLTDLTPGVDQSPQLVIEVGHGPLETSVEAFTFARAAPEPGYAAPVGVRSDRWVGPAQSAVLGELGVVGRASRDGGSTWRYCDLDGAGGTGRLAVWQVAETPCVADSCVSPPAAVCAADGVTLRRGESPGACSPTGATTFTCVYPQVAVDCGASGRVCQDDGGAVCGVTADGPQVGELVITEVMVTPTASRDVPSGQWVELKNRASSPRLLTGCTLHHVPALGEPEAVLVDAPLVVGVGGHVVFGATRDVQANGGAPVDFAWGDAIALTNASTLSLECDEVVDTIAWSSVWPLSSGATLALSPFSHDALQNDDPGVWCRADTSFGAGDRGSPGVENPRCPGDIVPIEGCRVAGPASVTPPAGTEAEVDLRVLVRSITGRTARTDPSPRLWLEVGLVPRGAAPSTVTGWRRASADLTWLSTGQGVDPAEDRYRGTYTVPAPGTWDLYARATADGGNSYSLCDLDGIVLGTARPLAVSPTTSNCFPSPCEAEPTSVCAPVVSGSPVQVVGRSGPAVCALEAGGPRCTYVETPLERCADRGAICAEDTAGAYCTGFPRTPEPGELVFSELMVAPLVNGLANELGEWVELTNVGDEALDLSGCALESDGAERWVLPPPPTPLAFVVMPGAALTFARSATASINGNSAPRAVWTGMALDNNADRVVLVCEVEVASVAWNASTWPIVPGRSLHLSGSYLENREPWDSSHWCDTATPSPAVVNLTCPGDGVVDDCRLVGEATVASADDTVGFEVDLYDPGVTDLSAGNDPAIGVVVQVGVGDPGASPRSSLGWTWYSATPEAGWSDTHGWDRWRAELTAVRPAELGLPVADPTAFAELAVMARVSHDGGKTFRVCGASGFSDRPADGIELTVTPGVCAPNPCRTPPAATCSGGTILGYSSPGVCTVANGQAQCQYLSRTFSCAAWGGCSGGMCNTPPARPTSAGALVITELLRDSGLPLPDRGEWVEIKNTTTASLDLRGCRFENGLVASAPLAGPVPELLNSGAHALFVQSTVAAENGGVPTYFVALRILGVELAETSGTLRLTCGGTAIDSVTWGPSWPGRRGVAMQLDRNAASWCEATSTYSALGLRGTPGSLNSLCP